MTAKILTDPGHSKTLFIADRGYENYNIFAHVQENGMFYLIRAKDITSNGIVSSLKNHLPDDRESFDTSVSITLTKKQMPEGLCKGSRLYYVTTAGGVIFDKAFGYGYIDFLSRFVFGIRRVKCFTAENLDLDGADTPKEKPGQRNYIALAF